MKLAPPRSLIDKLYDAWRHDLLAAGYDRQRLEQAMTELVVSHEWRDMLAEDVAVANGRERASKWAFATVLHADNLGAGLSLPVNWTYTESLADDYHLLVLRRQLVSRTQPALVDNAA